MPHYPLDLDDGYFAVYSTIVDNLISPEMLPTEMRDWLEANNYDSWLTPYDAEEVIRNYPEPSDGMVRLLRDNSRWYYYHDEAKFCYVKLADGYFCLPESEWRND